MGSPKVSVIVPVHNCAATLEQTFRSVFEQTLEPGLVEIIAVDDGSTDGSGELLDRLADGRPGMTVLHRPASGGPGRPRNEGLDRAAGEYVLFLDADDRLGPEALERCCAMADANGTDIVVPKYVGVGRRVHPGLFDRNSDFTTIFDPVPDLYGSITALKLYRRDLLERCDIRFPEGVLSGEDQIFAVRAYFEAKGISLLADYDCYYWVAREDGMSALQRGGAPAEAYFPQIERLLDFVAERTEPGPVRDRLMWRHFSIEILSRFDPRYQEFDEKERRATRDAARGLVERHLTPEIARRLSPYGRLIAHALRHGMDDLVDEAARVRAQGVPRAVCDDVHVFARYPGLRDERLGVPDEVYLAQRPPEQSWTLTEVGWRDGLLTVRGRPRVEPLGEAADGVELVLRLRDGTDEHRVPFTPMGPDRDPDGPAVFGADIDLRAAMPAPGRHDVFVVSRYQGGFHEGRLRRDEAAASPGARPAPVREGRPVVTPYFTKEAAALALHVGGFAGGRAPAPAVELSAVRPGLLRAVAVLETALPDGEVPVAVRMLLRHRTSGKTVPVETAVQRSPGSLRAESELDLGGLDRGKWDVSYEITIGSAAVVLRAAAPAEPDLRALPTGRKAAVPFRTVRGKLSVDCAGGRVSRLLSRLRAVPAARPAAATARPREAELHEAGRVRTDGQPVLPTVSPTSAGNRPR